jgi:hypothetical protein
MKNVRSFKEEIMEKIEIILSRWIKYCQQRGMTENAKSFLLLGDYFLGVFRGTKGQKYLPEIIEILEKINPEKSEEARYVKEEGEKMVRRIGGEHEVY